MRGARPPRRRLAVPASVLATVLVLALAACGTRGGGGGPSSGGPGASSGAQVFARAGCGGCHTLAAAGSQGQTGPNLDQVKPSAAVVERKVRNGGGGMPAFGGQLSDAQIKAVAGYVSSSAGRR